MTRLIFAEKLAGSGKMVTMEITDPEEIHQKLYQKIMSQAGEILILQTRLRNIQKQKQKGGIFGNIPFSRN